MSFLNGKKTREEPRLISEPDLLKNYSVRKGKAIKKLGLLYSAGVPAVFSSATRDELLLIFNLLMFRALHGKYSNINCGDLNEYAAEALREFKNLISAAQNCKAGARVKVPQPATPLREQESIGITGDLSGINPNNVTIYARNKHGSMFLPFKVFMSQYENGADLTDYQAGLIDIIMQVAQNSPHSAESEGDALRPEGRAHE